ncbi:nucleotidyltransferase family protein [Citrus sinensis]|uniref:Nucleotidyltransferase family protein n=1 Tax=Citrus sinensis TaxID=2711 RepID=A0ACB8NYQ7_CITSI|nr:nucleotidyltransferase family protein [Citrus sinensis]
MTKNKRHYYNELTFNSKLQLLTTTGTNRPVEPSSRWFKGNSRKKVIAKARVPIVKFFEKKSGVSFDISFDAQNGPKAAEFIKDALAECPPLRPLCLILKVFLQQRELNEVYSGGIGSFALLTMIMAVLKSLYECRASPEHNLEILLVNFFDFYGRKLKTTDVGVSCKGAGSFFKKSSKGFTNKGRPFLIAIEDPQNSFNYFQVCGIICV